jgi:regulatory protein
VPPTSRKRPPRRGFRQRTRSPAGPEGPGFGGVGAAADNVDVGAEADPGSDLLPNPLAVAERYAYLLLARRDHAAAELAARLVDKGHAPAVVASLVASLLERGYLNDERFAAHFVRAHGARGRGPLRIRRELEEFGLPSALVAEALAAGPDWEEAARALRRRRFGAEVPALWAEKARQMRFLQYRGFSPDHIRSALGAPDPDLDPTP